MKIGIYCHNPKEYYEILEYLDYYKYVWRTEPPLYQGSERPLYQGPVPSDFSKGVAAFLANENYTCLGLIINSNCKTVDYYIAEEGTFKSKIYKEDGVYAFSFGDLQVYIQENVSAPGPKRRPKPQPIEKKDSAAVDMMVDYINNLEKQIKNAEIGVDIAKEGYDRAIDYLGSLKREQDERFAKYRKAVAADLRQHIIEEMGIDRFGQVHAQMLTAIGKRYYHQHFPDMPITWILGNIGCILDYLCIPYKTERSNENTTMYVLKGEEDDGN